MPRTLDRKKIFEMYEQGFSLMEIADAVGARSTTYIQTLIREADGRGKVVNIDKGKIHALRKAGWSIADIVFEMGLPPEKVREVLSENYH